MTRKGKSERLWYMSGTVLIVDGVATNRIVLKVKLSSAYFRVGQSSSAAEALTQISRERPQAVVMAGHLPDAQATDLILQIRAQAGCEHLPILVICDADAKGLRLPLLEAGATDVIEKPINESVLLARLRSLFRQTPADAELGLHVDTAEALGFSEAPASYTVQGHIAALQPAASRLQPLWRTLASECRHRFEIFKMGAAGMLDGLTGKPDVLLLPLLAEATKPGLARLAELHTAPQTRQARILVLLDGSNPSLAATALDMGAHDIVSAAADTREINLRLNALVRAKQTEDTQKARLRTGLRAAVTDPLTGLYNRRYALSQMGRMIDAARASQDSFAIMVADLDHFKSVNDTYGHAAGDRVLTRVAHSLQDALRPGDILSRIGGEEFLILLPKSDKQMALSMAEHLCRIVRETSIGLPDGQAPLSVTISIGATIADPVTRGDLLTPERLLGQADRALYSAKSDGRDTVTMAQLSAA